MIKKIIDNPFLLLWLAPIPFWCLVIFQGNISIDIQLHDTYFVVSWLSLAVFVSVLTSLSLILYLRSHKYLWSRLLIWLQVVSAIACAYLYAYLFYVGGVGASLPRRYYGEVDIESVERFITSCNYIEYISMGLFFFSLAAFLVNIILGRWPKKMT